MPQNNITEQIARLLGVEFSEIKEEGQHLLDFMKAFRPGRKKDEHEEGGE